MSLILILYILFTLISTTLYFLHPSMTYISHYIVYLIIGPFKLEGERTEGLPVNSVGSVSE